MNILEEYLSKELKLSEVRAMADVVLKETNMLTARAEAIRDMAETEKNPLKMVEYCAEGTMISELMATLDAISRKTIEEAEKRNMIKK